MIRAQVKTKKQKQPKRRLTLRQKSAQDAAANGKDGQGNGRRALTAAKGRGNKRGGSLVAANDAVEAAKATVAKATEADKERRINAIKDSQ